MTDTLGKQIKLQALITEREGMIAENQYHLANSGSPVYERRFFDEKASQMRELLKADGADDTPLTLKRVLEMLPSGFTAFNTDSSLDYSGTFIIKEADGEKYISVFCYDGEGIVIDATLIDDTFDWVWIQMFAKLDDAVRGAG